MCLRYPENNCCAMVFATSTSSRKNESEREGSFALLCFCELDLCWAAVCGGEGCSQCQPLLPSLVNLSHVLQRRVKSNGWHQFATLSRTPSCALALLWCAICLDIFLSSDNFHEWVLWHHLAVVVLFLTLTAFSLSLFIFGIGIRVSQMESWLSARKFNFPCA